MRFKIISTILITIMVSSVILSCSSSNSTTTTADNGSSAVQEIASENDTNDSENTKTEQTETESINPDGYWAYDRVEDPVTHEAKNDVLADLTEIRYCIFGNCNYQFIDNGKTGFTTMKLIEENSSDSPIDIGPCDKYSINNGEAVFFSNDFWVYPRTHKDGSSLIYVLKRIDMTHSGQTYVEKNSVDHQFTESTTTETINGITFDLPSSWSFIKSQENGMRLYSPDTNKYRILIGVNEFDTCGNDINREDEEGRYYHNREDQLDYYIHNFLKPIEEDTNDINIESSNINGYLAKIVSFEMNGGSQKVYFLALTDKKIVIVSTSFPLGTEHPCAQDEMAVLFSFRPESQWNHSLIQSADQDPERDVYPFLIGAGNDNGHLGIPVKYVNHEGDSVPVSFRAYYNRAQDNDPVDVRIVISHNKEFVDSEVRTMYLGSYVPFNEFYIDSDDTGLWDIRLINDSTEEVLCEYVFETDYNREPPKSDGTVYELDPAIGMTAEQVENSSWGKPDKKNITETQYGTHEQWVYKGRGYIYIDDGIVSAIQWSE